MDDLERKSKSCGIPRTNSILYHENTGNGTADQTEYGEQ